MRMIHFECNESRKLYAMQLVDEITIAESCEHFFLFIFSNMILLKIDSSFDRTLANFEYQSIELIQTFKALSCKNCSIKRIIKISYYSIQI